MEHTSSRKQKNLGHLCRRFVQIYANEIPEHISLDGATQRLGVERRRIYDIVNILESFEVVTRSAKNTYKWNGLHKIAETIGKLE
jgi:transcription factor E2F7/8